VHAAADEQDRQAGRVQGKTNHSRGFFRQKLYKPCNYVKIVPLGLKFVQHCGFVGQDNEPEEVLRSTE
jgi:hypothetical protein